MKRFATILFLSIMGVVLFYTSYTLYISNTMNGAMESIGDTSLLSMFFSKSSIGHTIILIAAICISFIVAFYILNLSKNRRGGLK